MKYTTVAVNLPFSIEPVNRIERSTSVISPEHQVTRPVNAPPAAVPSVSMMQAPNAVIRGKLAKRADVLQLQTFPGRTRLGRSHP